MSLNDTMTNLMDSARKHFDINSKLSLGNLIQLFNPNPNLIEGAEDWSNASLNNLNTDAVFITTDIYKGMKVVQCKKSWNSPYFTFQVQKGETYTFSTYAKGDNNQAVGIYNAITGSNQITIPGYLDASLQVNEKWQRFSFTFTAIEAGTIHVRMEQASNDNLYLAGYKLEEGNLATPILKMGGVTKPVLIGFVAPRLEVAA